VRLRRSQMNKNASREWRLCVIWRNKCARDAC